MVGRIDVEHRNAVAILRFDDPSTLNSITADMIDELSRALDAAGRESRAVVLAGAGRAFCSGAGLGVAVSDDAGAESDLGMILQNHINPLMIQLRDLPIPWIAAVRGAAAGVGCSFALAGDLVIASETAFFLQAFVRIGLVPDGGATHLLARGVSRVRAMEMMMLGERVPAEKALAWGMINQVVPDADLDQAAFEMAQRLADGPTATYALIRQVAWRALDNGFDAALQTEREFQKAAGRTHDAHEGISAFVEKRPPRFAGH